MKQFDQKLMHALKTMQIEPAGAQYTFQKRLAQENGWSSAFAKRVIVEYKRFLYLTKVTTKPITPSDEVDQAWHLHLSYSRHYWDVLCKDILRKPLHHGPTAGGAKEDVRYSHQYSDTLRRYEDCFGEIPPRDIWPPLNRRFEGHYQRIRLGSHWLIPKTTAYVAGSALILSGCTEASATTIFRLAIFVIIVGGTYAVLKTIKERLSDRKSKKDNGCGSGSGFFDSSDSDSGCGGGCGGD